MSTLSPNSSYITSLVKHSSPSSLKPLFCSLAKYTLLLLILLNVKSLPTAYHWRCWWVFRKVTWQKRRELWERKKGKTEKEKSSQELFRVFRQEHRLWPDDLDLNIHMNDRQVISYLKVLDFLLIEHIFTLFGDLLLSKKLIIANGGCKIVYKKEIPPFAKYTVESRLLTWNDKWMFILSRFLLPSKAKTSDNNQIVATIVVNRMVFKERNGKTIEPAAVFGSLGFFEGESEEERDKREEARKKGWTFVEGLFGVDKLFEENEIWN